MSIRTFVNLFKDKWTQMEHIDRIEELYRAKEKKQTSKNKEGFML